VNEDEFARQEARAKRERETAAALAEIGIKPAEASLFHVVHFGITVTTSDLWRRAASPDYAVGGQLNPAAYEAALNDCLSKGWLQIIDDAVLGSLQNEVRRAGLLGPVYGYPELGGVDFTHAGAEQWFRICDRLWNGGSKNSFPFCDVVHVKTANYFLSKSAALSASERIKQDEDAVSITEPYSIGPWRAHWWQRFSEGYCIEVEQRRQWQGRTSEGCGGIIVFDALALPIDRAYAKNVLDRHGIAWVEWLVMASLEQYNASESDIASWAAMNAKRLGESLSEEVCLLALETCIQKGWLRRVDETTTAEIRSLLRADSAVMPVQFDPTGDLFGIVFTVAGAQLYRIASAEILGRDWEDDLYVEDTLFVEVHYYCATESGVLAVQGEYADSGKIPTSVRTVPIGPWCVYWWEQFSSGYRVELTFGKQ
jgi:hypothetical protein